MPALRPIQREAYSRQGSDIEALKLFALSSGAYLDNATPGYPRTRLGVLTAGTRARGSMSIRGGSL